MLLLLLALLFAVMDILFFNSVTRGGRRSSVTPSSKVRMTIVEDRAAWMNGSPVFAQGPVVRS